MGRCEGMVFFRMKGTKCVIAVKQTFALFFIRFPEYAAGLATEVNEVFRRGEGVCGTSFTSVGILSGTCRQISHRGKRGFSQR